MFVLIKTNFRVSICSFGKILINKRIDNALIAEEWQKKNIDNKQKKAATITHDKTLYNTGYIYSLRVARSFAHLLVYYVNAMNHHFINTSLN